MRRLLLILMIALLPLRAWAGDVMAIQMAAAGFAQTALTALTAQTTSANEALTEADDMRADHADCPGHSSMAYNAKPSAKLSAEPSDVPGAEPTQSSQSQCNSCVSCQICHNVAVAASVLGSVGHKPVFQAPSSDAHRFASVEPAQSQKPPIS